MPFVFSFHPAFRFRQVWHAFFSANILVAILFVVWDAWFTSAGVWGFNRRYVCGIFLGNLPIEEIMFFVCIPYASLFTYHCLKLYLKRFTIRTKLFSSLVAGGLILTAAIFHAHPYTLITFACLGFFILWLEWFYKPVWLVHFYLSYAIILVPFFVVNGILTGTGIDEPVVWYNNSENLGVRLFTIPVEDMFYGMLLLLANTFLFELFLERHLLGAINLTPEDDPLQRNSVKRR